MLRASLRGASLRGALLRGAPAHRLLQTAASRVPAHRVGPVVAVGSAAAFAAAWTRGGAACDATLPPPPTTLPPPPRSGPATTIRLVDNGRVQLRVLAQLVRRIAELLVCFLPPLGWLLLRQLPVVGAPCFTRARLHALVVGALARAGPVGIKWGQWASTR